MADFRHKEADRGCRRGLEELLLRGGRGDGCVGEEAEEAGAGGGEGADHLARRRRRSDLEGDDLAETSAAARRHSRILSRWAARQAEEMITTIERRNRESELMALARLHAVSMLDASFLRESRRAQSSVERPVAARASSVLRMWRDLEDESIAGDRRSPASSPTTASNNHRSAPEIHDPMVRRNSLGVASEINASEYSQWPDRPTALGRRGAVDDSEDWRSSREQSPDIGGGGDGERERVREIVSGWMTEIGMTDTASQVLPGSDSPRSEWLGERERERVRLVREWMQTVSQQRDGWASRREERDREGLVANQENRQRQHVQRNLLRLRGRQARLDLIMRNVRERERELQALSEHRPVSHFAQRNRIQTVLRGRFLRNGGPVEDGQRHSVAARELGQLRQHHTVSGFREGFRSREDGIVTGEASNQSDGIVTGEASNQSVDVDNINVSSNNLTVSSTLEVSDETHDQFRANDTNVDGHQLEEVDTTSQMESSMQISDMVGRGSAIQEDNWLADDVEHEQRDSQQPIEVGSTVQHDGPIEEHNSNWHENEDHEWLHDAPEDEDGRDSHLLEAHEHWHEDNSQVTEANWQDGPSDSFNEQHSFPVIRNTFVSSEDGDDVYNVELRELLSRRSVSNLLRSGFRESLDQLVQSYIQRQERDPFQWDMERTMPNHVLPGEDQSQQRDLIHGQRDSVTRPLHATPMPPTPPPLPPWHSELHHSWSRQSIRRPEVEWDMINDLKADMARFQQVMSNMQRMLEACMDMQLELQRAVRQEVSAALNHSVGEHGEESSQDGTKWRNVRKGVCCVCCDSHIDCLLYRCGHMCTCSRCANELVQGGGKCPLCRAPIVEVIRAYSVV
ncbi:RING [Musa troglodytarum]|uniref:RING n=1 Tax=Musa troglodytarum TaxID=320322 RepID=A0A9E7FXD2_9LILI|nr:RING [Musa troglodytarum]